MAIDTAARRLSAIHPLSPWRGLGLLPSGAIGNKERAALRGLYQGVPFTNAYSIEASHGEFFMTGQSAELTPTTNINTAQKRFAAMNIGNPWRGLNLFPTGSIGLVGRKVLKNYYIGFGQAYTYTITAGHGDFAWDGEPAFSDFEVTAQSGTYAMSGSAATLIATRTLFASAGAYAMTGNDANLAKFTERTLVATSGTFAMTGSDVTFGRPRTLVASAGSFGMTGHEIPGAQPNAGPFHKKFRRKYAMWVGGKRYLGTQEDFEKLVAASFAGSVSDEFPAISVRVDTRRSFEDAASELERELEAALRKIQRDAYRKRREEEELNFL